MDSKQSEVKSITRLAFRSVLPRATDAIFGSLEQQRDSQADELVAWLVADVAEAFWLIPLRMCERKYFVGS
eukprot:5334952-Heterocapsa_arctica.AAC.1